MNPDRPVDRRTGLAGSSSNGEPMGWLDKFKDPNDLRWLAFLLAALVGLLAIIMAGGINW